MNEVSVLPGCEAWSHRAQSAIGAVVVHGFTGAPHGMRGIAEALAAAGFDVELPRLPGHGTSVDDMMCTDWSDWSRHVAEVVDHLSQRVERVVLIGQSMGGSLVLRTALDMPTVAAVVCINPVTRGRDADFYEMLTDFIDDGITVAPGDGSDIADPDATDVTYPDTPLAPLRSLLVDGVGPIADRYGELTMPLRLFTSRQDHVVDPGDSEHLAATWGGAVEHTWLERGYHVASVDYDRDIVIDGTVAFVASLDGGR
jgi:carboxylesterase